MSNKILMPKSTPVNVVNNKERVDIINDKANIQRDMMVMVALGTLAESIHKHMSNTDSTALQTRIAALAANLDESTDNCDELLYLLLAYCWETHYNVAAGVIKKHKEVVEKDKSISSNNDKITPENMVKNIETSSAVESNKGEKE